MANLFVGNDNDVYLQGYVLAATGAAVTDALPAFTVYFNVGTENDPVQGSAISGLSAISMSFVAGTNGDYRGKIKELCNLWPVVRYRACALSARVPIERAGAVASPSSPLGGGRVATCCRGRLDEDVGRSPAGLPPGWIDE